MIEKSATSKSSVLSASSYVTEIPFSVFDVTIPPTASDTASLKSEILVDSRVGMSVATSDLNVGIAAVEPVAGPARTVLTATVFHSKSSVPLYAAGEPVTVNRSGAVNAIDTAGTSSVYANAFHAEPLYTSMRSGFVLLVV